MKIKNIFSAIVLLSLFLITLVSPLSNFVSAESFLQKPLPSFSLRLLNSDSAVINKERITFDTKSFSTESIFSKIPLTMEYEIENGETASEIEFILPLCARPYELPTLSISADSETLPYEISYGRPYFDNGNYESLIKTALAPTIPLSDLGTFYSIDTIPGQALSVELSYFGDKAIFHSGYNQSTQKKGHISFTLENPQSDLYQIFVSNGDFDSLSASSTYTKQAVSYEKYFNMIFDPLQEFGFLQSPRNFYLSLFSQAIAGNRICDAFELLNKDNSPYISVAKFSKQFATNETITLRIETQAAVVVNPNFEPYISMLQFFTGKNKKHAFELNFLSSPAFPYIIESPLSLIETADGYSFSSDVVPEDYYLIFSSSESPTSKFDKPANNKNNTILFIILDIVCAGVLVFFIIYVAIKSKKNNSCLMLFRHKWLVFLYLY